MDSVKFTLEPHESSGNVFMKWKGVFTEGNCSIRGTRVYLTMKGGYGYCTGCELNYFCDEYTNSIAHKTIDHLNFRDVSLQHIIQEIKTTTPLKFWNDDAECEDCNINLVVKFEDKEGVLQELTDVDDFIKKNNVYQDWI